MFRGGRGNAPRPGRVNTFFNSPYAAQVSNNLSAAIYGDPRDELVREQIQNAQAARQRQVEQDQIASEQRQTVLDAQTALGDMMTTNPDNWQAGITPALQAGVSLSDVYTMAGLYDPRYRQKLALQENDAANAKGLATHQGEIRSGHMTQQAEIDRYLTNLKQGFTANENLLDRNHTSSENRLDRGHDLERDQWGRAEDLLGDAFGQGYYLPDLANSPGYLPPEHEAPPLEGLEAALIPTEDPTSDFYGGGGSGSKVKPPSAGDLKNYDMVLEKVLANAAGGNAKFAQIVEDPAQVQAFKQRGIELLSQSNNAATAMAQLLAEFELSHTPADEPWLWFNTPESLEINPRKQQSAGRDNDPLGIR